MTCRELVEALDRHLEGALDRAAAIRVEEHLAGCADCRRYLRGYRAASELARKKMKRSSDETRPLPERLVERIVAAQRRNPR